MFGRPIFLSPCLPARHEQVEQTVEVPVPMTQEEVVHVPTVTWRRLGRWEVVAGS